MRYVIVPLLGIVLATFAIEPPSPPPPPPELVQITFQYKERLTDANWTTLYTVWSGKQSGFYRTVISK